MGLGRFVLMSHSEVESGGRQRLSILADAFESVVGAIYLDQGFEAAREFIERWLLRESRTIAADKRHTNYKSHLQEYVQSTFRTHPVYRIRSEMGPDHSKQFNVEVMVGRRVLGEGKGRNKKEAEQAAARNALERVESPVDAEPRPRRREPVDPPARPRAGLVEPSIATVPETSTERSSSAEEGEGREPRRRRGRRGGRGRRGRGEGPASDVTPESPSPAADDGPARERAPARAAPAPVKAIREIPKSSPRALPFFQRGEETERVVRPIEYEPPPARHEEDENEEVGRPEGPHEERHVDPYAWDPVPAATESVTSDEESGALEVEVASEPVREESSPAEYSPPDEEPSEPPQAPPRPPASPTYGRRQRRGSTSPPDP
jgi:hypothetical protein